MQSAETIFITQGNSQIQSQCNNPVKEHAIHHELKSYKFKLLGKLVVRDMVSKPSLAGDHVFEPTAYLFPQFIK